MDVLILLFLLIGIAVLLARGSVADRMVEARIQDDALWIALRGMNRVWAGRSEVTIPLSCVVDVRVEVEPQALPSGVRLPGVWIPQVLTAGTYRKPGGRSFFAIAHGRDALVLDLDGHEYVRVVIDVDNPELLGDEIRRGGAL